MNILGIASAIVLNLAIFTMYYLGLTQNDPVSDSRTAAAFISSGLAPLDASSHAESLGDLGEKSPVTRSAEHENARNGSNEVHDGKEVIEYKEVVDPEIVAAVGVLSDPVAVGQPALLNAEFRPARHKLGITSAPNPANLQPPAVSPESR